MVAWSGTIPDPVLKGNDGERSCGGQRAQPASTASAPRPRKASVVTRVACTSWPSSSASSTDGTSTSGCSSAGGSTAAGMRSDRSGPMRFAPSTSRAAESLPHSRQAEAARPRRPPARPAVGLPRDDRRVGRRARPDGRRLARRHEPAHRAGPGRRAAAHGRGHPRRSGPGPDQRDLPGRVPRSDPRAARPVGARRAGLPARHAPQRAGRGPRADHRPATAGRGRRARGGDRRSGAPARAAARRSRSRCTSTGSTSA